MSALFAFCRDQPWWALAEPMLGQDVVVDVHVAAVPDVVVTEERRSLGLSFAILHRTSDEGGILVVRACGECRSPRGDSTWHLRVTPREGVTVAAIAAEVMAQAQGVRVAAQRAPAHPPTVEWDS